jgi:hypothetical protein
MSIFVCHLLDLTPINKSFVYFHFFVSPTYKFACLSLTHFLKSWMSYNLTNSFYLLLCHFLPVIPTLESLVKFICYMQSWNLGIFWENLENSIFIENVTSWEFLGKFRNCHLIIYFASELIQSSKESWVPNKKVIAPL